MIILFASALFFASLCNAGAELELNIGRKIEENVISELLHRVLDVSLTSHQQLFLISEMEDVDVVMGRDDLTRTIFTSIKEMKGMEFSSSRSDFYIVLGSTEWAEKVLEALYSIRPEMWWTSKALFVLEARPGDDWIQEAANLMIPITVAKRIRPDMFAFYAVCPFCNGSHPGMQYIQMWRPGSKGISKNLFPDLLNDFHGKEFRVSAAHAPFFYEWSANGTMEDWTGFEGAALKAMALHFNFRVIPTPARTGVTGKLVNGTWDGHIRMILDGITEFGVGKISQTWIRNQYVHFTTMVTIEAQSFIAQKPQLLPYSGTVYRPFTPTVWILCAISIVAMGITFALCRQRSFNGLKVEDEIFMAYGSFMVKGFRKLDNEVTRMRLIRTVWLISCLFISLIYNSVISSYIISPSTTSPINTLEEAVQRTNIPFTIFLGNDALIQTIRESDNPTYKIVASRLKLVPSSIPRATLDNIYMDVPFQLDLEIWKQKEAGNPVWTEVRIADETFTAMPSAWPIRKYKPYKPKIDLFIQRLHDAGLFNKWMSDSKIPLGAYFALKDVVSVSAEVKRISFGIVHVQGIFYALAFGLTLASFVFISSLPRHRNRYDIKGQLSTVEAGAYNLCSIVLQAAYLPVPNTTRYIKMVYEPWLLQKDPTYVNKNWNQSLAACKAEGAWLAIDNDDTIHKYLYDLLMANGIYPDYKCLWIGGYSTIDKWHWELLDGKFMGGYKIGCCFS
ncbi:unnamed protein product [Darwinula stevensoni]|uniref:Uncharacterized protein n=1 Tax=Darwinula stevensoni TaxID=69355 RepID=A0A7R9A996_9CRUS|nr:unnamed protein product [Darwinula stevensoni]CAG0897211.1 unnamed protein product [Darwinula stevensoni]